MKYFILSFIVCILLSGCVSSNWKDFYGDPQSSSIPSEVRRFVTNMQGCTHFSGEDAYDKKRAAFLKKSIDAMCPGLEAKHDYLLKHYAGNKEITDLIAQAWLAFGQAFGG
jgi:hypothetical protein